MMAVKAWRSTARAALFTAMLVLSLPSPAQTPDEHASHHPPPEQASNTSVAPSPMQSDSSEDEREGEHKHDGNDRGLYATLMSFKEVTGETREQVEYLARERMSTGVASMSRGIEKLQRASEHEDLAAMSHAVAEIRTGVHDFNSGTAALQALSNGESPREVALGWFRDNLQLQAAETTPWWKLSAFHYFVMALFLTTAGTLLFLNFQKMRRAQALVTRLVPERSAPASLAPIATPAVPSISPENVTPLVSRSNAWTGLMRVARIFEETTNVRTLRLAELNGGPIPFEYLPGQFLTVTVRPHDQTIKRSYTIASSPTRRDFLEITVKREDLGTVSNFLHAVHEGDTIQITGPSGNFTFLGEGANSIVLIAGGVGVTPMMSVLRYLTDRSWSGDIYFIYGCRSDADVIYREELGYLQRRFPNLHLMILAGEVVDPAWPYQSGIISKELLRAHVPHVATRRIHLCGPPKMMEAIKALLTELGVPAERVKAEVFIGKERPVAPAQASQQAAVGDNTTALHETKAPSVSVVAFARSNRTAMLPPDRTILEAAEEIGVNIDYSCRVGLCGLCKVKLISGDVSMDVQESLSEEDKKQSLILACQAKPKGDVRVDA